MNLYNNKDNIKDNQSLYDNYNDFMMSNDRNVFFKLFARHDIFNLTRELNGDIVECGVFKGSGLLSWLKMLDMYQPHSIKKVIGFDFFDLNFVDSLNDTVDKTTMKQVFSRDTKLKNEDISLEGINKKIINAGFKSNKFELIKGDISATSSEFIKTRPGFRISLLYLDMDLEKPTFDALTNLWDRVVSGGVVVFDEYAYHSWSEANAVDKFFKDKNVKFINTHIQTPTAYIIKG